jgi:hypothetical protein
VSDFMRVARSLAWQQSLVMRAYARAGKVVLHPASSCDVLDEALELVSSHQGMSSWRSRWLPRAGAPACADVA